MDVLMLVISDVAHDARVLREAVCLADSGHAIHLLGKDVPDGWTPPPGITVQSVSGGSGLKPSGGVFAASAASGGALRRTARWMLLPRHRQRVWRTWCRRARTEVSGRKFDVVHAHDFNVLRLAAELAEDAGAQLVYDAHEWWSGRERHGRPAPLERARGRRAEQRIVARAAAVLTVSDGIARRLERWRGAPVAVVRNTFPALDRSAATPVADLPERPCGAVYAGRIGAARDIETLLAAAAELGLPAVLVGKADREFLPRLRFSAGSVRIEPARPVDEVDEVLRRAGISVVTLTDSCENHRLALPNKVFHAVRAGVPVAAADLPELRRLVTEHGLGALYRPGDAASLRAALEQVIWNYPEFCARVAQARGELSWERDANALIGVYASLAGDAVSAGVR